MTNMNDDELSPEEFDQLLAAGKKVELDVRLKRKSDTAPVVDLMPCATIIETTLTAVSGYVVKEQRLYKPLPAGAAVGHAASSASTVSSASPVNARS